MIPANPKTILLNISHDFIWVIVISKDMKKVANTNYRSFLNTNTMSQPYKNTLRRCLLRSMVRQAHHDAHFLRHSSSLFVILRHSIEYLAVSETVLNHSTDGQSGNTF